MEEQPGILDQGRLINRPGRGRGRSSIDIGCCCCCCCFCFRFFTFDEYLFPGAWEDLEAILTGEDKIGRSLGEMNFDSSGVREI